MVIIDKDVNIDITYIRKRFNNLDNILIFDIETTGFSYRKNLVYLIGCLYFVDKQPKIIQWLAENENDEYAVIYEFIKFSSSYNSLIHFNGTSFDIPFITKKAHLYNINNNLSSFNSIDIYKMIKPYKHLFNLNNYKLKSIEEYLNIRRKDKYSGAVLINQFISYTTSNDIITRNNLLQHNEDDITGLSKSLIILDYIDTYNNLINNRIPFSVDDFTINKLNLSINISLAFPVPFNYIYTNDDYIIDINKDCISINIKLIDNELKYYFDNYKDYYYVYSEDQAIHKNIAKYIDKNNRIRATKDLCYIKKRGIFIPLMANHNIDNENIFYISKTCKTKYIMLQDKNLQDKDYLDKLCINIIKNL